MRQIRQAFARAATAKQILGIAGEFPEGHSYSEAIAIIEARGFEAVSAVWDLSADPNEIGIELNQSLDRYAGLPNGVLDIQFRFPSNTPGEQIGEAWTAVCEAMNDLVMSKGQGILTPLPLDYEASEI